MNKQARYILLLMRGEPRRVKSQFLPSKALCAGEAFARASECEASPGLPSKRHLTGRLQWPKPGWLSGSRLLHRAAHGEKEHLLSMKEGPGGPRCASEVPAAGVMGLNSEANTSREHLVGVCCPRWKQLL